MGEIERSGVAQPRSWTVRARRVGLALALAATFTLPAACDSKRERCNRVVAALNPVLAEAKRAGNLTPVHLELYSEEHGRKLGEVADSIAPLADRVAAIDTKNDAELGPLVGEVEAALRDWAEASAGLSDAFEARRTNQISEWGGKDGAAASRLDFAVAALNSHCSR